MEKKIEMKNDGKEFDRFEEFTRKIVSVPKSEIDRREDEYQDQKKREKEGLASPSFCHP